MKTRYKTIFLIFSIFVCMLFLWWLHPTLRIRSEKAIRANLLKKTPLDSSAEEVVHYIEKKWSVENRELISRPAFVRNSFGDPIIPVGTSHIGPVPVGSYWYTFPGLPAITYVYVTWVFDENGKLIDILVNKETDAV